MNNNGINECVIMILICECNNVYVMTSNVINNIIILMICINVCVLILMCIVCNVYY